MELDKHYRETITWTEVVTMKFKQAATDQRLEEAADKRLQENIHSEIDSIVLAFTAKKDDIKNKNIQPNEDTS